MAPAHRSKFLSSTARQNQTKPRSSILAAALIVTRLGLDIEQRIHSETELSSDAGNTNQTKLENTREFKSR